ncbi:NAD(P)/FAD-dependent oxidoreductase [Streptomyces sp. NBC_01408]|uniref:FAD-dependent oxidoreductase n=1 Tax=Streptomyces sp. NBC_01408 TaxID=2903855 RepID=UPI002250B23E|nr:FAD-dependent monooxygenase [Streptomyces sp. NBC_01408]MCX4691124.1 FAD-dependent monooxygenase [Streptomyces sp. NBC_01408]
MRVSVIGGGVAGAASAIALRRRTGAEVTVHEAYETVSDQDAAGQVGSFLSLAVNGLRGLDELGCLAAVQAAGFPVADQLMWSASGKLLGRVPRGRLASDTLHSTTLLRGRLVEVLRAEAVRAGARFVTGRRVVPSEAEGDLVVAADGIWSAARTALDPAAPAPEYAGLYSVSGVSHLPDLARGSFHMVFGHRGAFLYIPAPDGTVWWSAQVAAPEPPDPAEVTSGLLEELYRTSRMPLEVLRAATRVDRPTPMHRLAELPVWHDDRTVLIGDAAHPVGAGQGASMAIEDAVALAGAVAASPDVPSALAAYTRLRRPRAARMTRSAASNRDSKTPGTMQRRVNDLLMPFVFRHAYARSTSWLYR